MRLAGSPDAVPSGTSSVVASVRDVEYMGSYRTALLALGAAGLPGKARLEASDARLAPGDAVVAWWEAERQRMVAA